MSISTLVCLIPFLFQWNSSRIPMDSTRIPLEWPDSCRNRWGTVKYWWKATKHQKYIFDTWTLKCHTKVIMSVSQLQNIFCEWNAVRIYFWWVHPNTSPCPTDSCRNGSIPLESAGMGRNPQEWHWNGLKWTFWSYSNGLDKL